MSTLMRLLNSYQCYATQLWSAWTLINVLSADVTSYAVRFLNENGLDSYSSLRKTYAPSAHIHIFLDKMQEKLKN